MMDCLRTVLTSVVAVAERICGTRPCASDAENPAWTWVAGEFAYRAFATAWRLKRVKGNDDGDGVWVGAGCLSEFRRAVPGLSSLCARLAVPAMPGRCAEPLCGRFTHCPTERSRWEFRLCFSVACSGPWLRPACTSNPAAPLPLPPHGTRS